MIAPPDILAQPAVGQNASKVDPSLDESIIHSDRSWSSRVGGKFLLYFGPHLKNPIPRKLLQTLLRKRKALAAVYAYDWDNGIQGPQYSIICDTPSYKVDDIPSSNARSKVRRGLKRCEVRRVDIEWLADHGYGVSRRARERYMRSIPEGDAEGFVRNARKYQGREDLRVYGAFVEEKLVAFGWTFDRGDAVRLGPTAFDPAHSSSYPMYAMFYSIAHERLNDDVCRFIDNGSRPMSHETNIDEFLFSLGWRKAYTRLGFECVARLRLAIGAARALRPVWQRLLSKERAKEIQSLITMAQVARQTKPSP